MTPPPFVIGRPPRSVAHVTQGAPEYGCAHTDWRIPEEVVAARMTRRIARRIDGRWVREMVPLTDRELADRGLFVRDRSDGFVTLTCNVSGFSPNKPDQAAEHFWRRAGLGPLLDASPEILSVPAKHVEIEDGRRVGSRIRHRHAPAAIKRATHRARVIRHEAHAYGYSLREQMETRVAEHGGNRAIPAQSKRAHDAEVIDEARKLTRRHCRRRGELPSAVELRVPLSQVQPGDIVVSVGHEPRPWAGEP